ncbi:MAG: CDP-alcohol phosphatidyltransferase family protein [Nocardioidaceae bacterium]
MIDGAMRRALEKPLSWAATAIDRPGVSPDRLTVAGLVVGLASAGAAAAQLWWLALVLWLLSRLADGLDGPLARRRKHASVNGADPASGAGGFLDITTDFVVYGSTVVGVAVGVASGHGAPWWPFLLVLLAYYVNGTAFLAFSSIAERTGRTIEDGRSLSFLGGLAEGTETIVVHSVWLLIPAYASEIAVGWAAVVAISAAQRVVGGYRDLA